MPGATPARGHELEGRPAGCNPRVSTTLPRVSGFGALDRIELADVGFGAHTTLGYAAASDRSGGTLTLTDGTHSARIALLGTCIAASFATAGDGHGGTLITERSPFAPPPLAQPHA